MTGPEVKTILKERGISVNKCAQDMGLYNSTLSQILNGKISFYPKYRKALEEYLDIEIPAEHERRDTFKGEPKVIVLNLYITKSMASIIETIANEHHLSKSEVARRALKEGLGL